MTVIVYKCDTCNREIEIPQNINGLETVGRCIITHGCRGKLYQQKVLPDYTRGNLSPGVDGLQNWIPRKVLYDHTQTIQRDTWTIQHDMGTAPVVSVYVDRPTSQDPNNREEITPDDIIIQDENIVILKFDRPWSGIAQLVTNQSDPHIFDTQPIVQSETARQFSTSGEITIATRINTVGQNNIVNINIEYTNVNQTTIDQQYVADDQPSINSPWIDYDRAVIKGKIYTIRSFNAIIPEMTSGVITSGSTMQFNAIDPNNDGNFRQIQQGEVLLLLSQHPYQVVDKITNQFVDVSKVTSDQNNFGLYYDNGEFYNQPDIIETIYPPIRSV